MVFSIPQILSHCFILTTFCHRSMWYQDIKNIGLSLWTVMWGYGRHSGYFNTDREKKADPQLAVAIINGLCFTAHTALGSALTLSYLALVQRKPGSSKSGAFSDILVNVDQGINSISFAFDAWQITFGLRFVKVILIPFGALQKMLSRLWKRLISSSIKSWPSKCWSEQKNSFCLQSWLDEDTNVLGSITKSRTAQPSSTPGSLKVDSDQ